VTVPDTEQSYIEVTERQKFDILCRLLDIQSPELAIIFGRTKRRVDELQEGLNTRGYSTEGIHGDLNQSKRDSVLRHFREGTTTILVATDVAARGLDIAGVTHVYNFDIPQDPEGYVHRIGRTGRAGKTGLAVTLVTPREIGHLELIEKAIKRKITRKPIPTLIEAIEGQQRLAVEKLIRAVEDRGNRQYRELAEDLLGQTDPVSLLSAALKLLTKQPDTTPVKITEEPPLRTRRPWNNKKNRQPDFRKRIAERGYSKPDRKRQKPAKKAW
jgi:ATP-dependent RNA helicase DeaD